LIDYEGTVIMVSHDRDFMKGICDRLFEFREGKVKEYLCDIEEFMQIRKVERLNQLDLDKTGKVQEIPDAKPAPAKVATSGGAEKEAEQKQIRNQIKKAEENISNLETKMKECDDKLANPDEYAKLMNDKAFFASYEKLKKDLETEMLKWEELSGKLS
jgi:ATP-binding cassette subfamily F protein 3